MSRILELADNYATLTADTAAITKARAALEAEVNRVEADNKRMREALELWLDIQDRAAGYIGKYGKELDAAIVAQQERITKAADASRAAIGETK